MLWELFGTPTTGVSTFSYCHPLALGSLNKVTKVTLIILGPHHFKVNGDVYTIYVTGVIRYLCLIIIVLKLRVPKHRHWFTDFHESLLYLPVERTHKKPNVSPFECPEDHVWIGRYHLQVLENGSKVWGRSSIRFWRELSFQPVSGWRLLRTLHRIHMCHLKGTLEDFHTLSPYEFGRSPLMYDRDWNTIRCLWVMFRVTANS